MCMELESIIRSAVERLGDCVEGIRLYDKACKHFIVYGCRHTYYTIYTTSVLLEPRKVGIDFDRPMLGVRTSVLKSLPIVKVMWLLRLKNCVFVLVQRVDKIMDFCIEFKAFYRNDKTGETICNYPLAYCEKVFEKCESTLERYVGLHVI